MLIDLHENWPHAIQDWAKEKVGLSLYGYKQIHGFDRWLKFEKCDPKSDHIIVVVEEMKLRLVEVHRVDEDKISIVSNFESNQFLNGMALGINVQKLTLYT